MKTQNDGNVPAPNADDFLGGNYLRKEDLGEPITVTVTDVWSEDVLNSGRQKLIVAFRELTKPMVLNKTNIKRFARIFENVDTSMWRGPVTLYVDQSVEFAGRIVGGLRVKPASRASDRRGEAATQQPVVNGQARAEQYEEAGVDFF